MKMISRKEASQNVKEFRTPVVKEKMKYINDAIIEASMNGKTNCVINLHDEKFYEDYITELKHAGYDVVYDTVNKKICIYWSKKLAFIEKIKKWFDKNF